MNIMKIDARSQVPQSHVPTKFTALQGAAHKNKNYPIVHENSKKSNFQITRNPCKQGHESPSKLAETNHEQFNEQSRTFSDHA